MTQIYPDEGLVAWLDRALTADIQYGIFVNDITPDRDTELADLTDSGATLVTVELADFTIKSVAAHIGTALAAPIAIPNDSGSSKDGYGYYVIDVSGTELLAVARFDSAPVTKDVAESWNVVPILGDFSSNS